MDDTEPPDLTIVVYKTLTGQYYPVVIGNNGKINEELKNYFNPKHIFGIYKIKPKYENEFSKLCDDSFKKNEGVVRRRIEELLDNGEKY